MDWLSLNTGPRGGETLYRQLYWRFRDAIASGKLAAGDRVPSVRALAGELHIAKGTVETAYQMLISEGYLQSAGPAGTRVSPRLEAILPARTPAPTAHSLPAEEGANADVQPFQAGIPALDAFPRKTWVRLTTRHLRKLAENSLTYPPPSGLPALRRALASYLGISRGIRCTPDQVLITSGYTASLTLICRTLLQAGDTGWFEEPGFHHARRVLQQAGMHLQAVPVDEDGLSVAAGQQAAEHAHFAVVTPTHQSPLGVALSLPRRLALLDWAVRRSAWIIEDDYDSEFRYHGHPLPALKSLDHDGRVVYAGTFSKVLYPGLRLAYLVVPQQEAARFHDTARTLQSGCPLLMQQVVTDFIDNGHFSRHLQKMRVLYAQRRAWLVQALEQAFGASIRIPPRAGGIHVLAYLNSGADDTAIAAAANAQGLAVQALNNWRTGSAAVMPPGLLLGFANLQSAEQTAGLVNKLKLIVGALLPPV